MARMSIALRGPEDPLQDEKFRVLVVCTANLCRSPIAETLLRKAVEDRWAESAEPHWTIRSAGSRARSGEPMHPLALAVIEEREVPAPEFRSQPLTAALVAEADLILTAERKHRAAVVTAVPSAVRRTFTLRQMARVASAMDLMPSPGTASERGAYLLKASVAARAQLQPVSAELDDLADPVGHGIGTFRHCAATIDDAISDILLPISVLPART